ncbi:MAG: DUF2442 domain-containing protein [Ignavibacteriae bacterium]|nr:DUF2442 domain-containing protein [Ignavibacteriota bacterium]
MRHIKTARSIGEYRLELEFDNGVQKVVDLGSYLRGEIFVPLKDKKYFATVTVHPELETVFWENGADFSPDFLYEIGKEIRSTAAANA